MNPTLVKLLFSKLSSVFQAAIAAGIAWLLTKLALLDPDLAKSVDPTAVGTFVWGVLLALINLATNHISNQTLATFLHEAMGEEPESKRSNPPKLPLVLLALVPLFMLSGCAWTAAHKTQIDQTLAIIGQRAEALALQVIVSAATDAADKGFKADFLDSVAYGLRTSEANIVTSDDVEKIVGIWSPNDGAQWQALAGKAAAIAGSALASNGQAESAAVVEQIATGLNNAAASARSTP